MNNLANFEKCPLEDFHDGLFLGYKYNQSDSELIVFVVDADGRDFFLRATDVIAIEGILKELASSIYEIQHEQSLNLSTINIVTNMATEISIEFSGVLECYKMK